MIAFFKTLLALIPPDSRLDKVVWAAKEAVLVLIVAQAILAKAQEVLQSFLIAAK